MMLLYLKGCYLHFCVYYLLDEFGYFDVKGLHFIIRFIAACERRNFLIWIPIELIFAMLESSRRVEHRQRATNLVCKVLTPKQLFDARDRLQKFQDPKSPK